MPQISQLPAATIGNNTDIYPATQGGSTTRGVSAKILLTTPIPPAIVTSGASYSIQNTDRHVLVNKTTGSATTLTLPNATAGELHTIKDSKGDSATNNITVNPSSGTIDGQSNFVINVNYSSVDFLFDGTNWSVV